MSTSGPRHSPHLTSFKSFKSSSCPFYVLACLCVCVCVCVCVSRGKDFTFQVKYSLSSPSPAVTNAFVSLSHCSVSQWSKEKHRHTYKWNVSHFVSGTTRIRNKNWFTGIGEIYSLSMPWKVSKEVKEGRKCKRERERENWEDACSMFSPILSL